MKLAVFEKLFQQQLITEAELEEVKQLQQRPVSVHWDLRTLLYLGILLTTPALLHMKRNM